MNYSAKGKKLPLQTRRLRLKDIATNEMPSFSLPLSHRRSHPVKILLDSLNAARSCRVDAPIHPLYTQPSTPGRK